jgi:pentatricopeptide repeat protein
MTDRWKINPNSYTLSILIKRFGRQGDLTKAFELVYELPRKYGFRANAHVWTCLISACVTHGELHTAESVLNAMSGKKNCVRIFCSAAFEDASLVNRAVEMASACPPDAKTFETLSQGFLRFNEVRKALDVVTEGAQRFGGKMNPQCVAQVAQTAAQMGLDVSLLAREFGGR